MSNFHTEGWSWNLYRKGHNNDNRYKCILLSIYLYIYLLHPFNYIFLLVHISFFLYCIYSSIYPPMHLFIRLSFSTWIYLSIGLYLHTSIYLSFFLYLHLLTILINPNIFNISIYQSICPFTQLSINSSNCSSVYPSKYIFDYQSTYPSLYLTHISNIYYTSLIQLLRVDNT